MIPLFKTQNHISTTNELKLTLQNLDIKKGDILYIHSEIFNFGIPVINLHDLQKNIIDCFFEVVGNEGTMLMPTFTYSFCNNKVYDKLNSKTKIGVLNEFFRKLPGVKRTNDPLFSFAVKGAKEKLFLKETNSCFGENSVFDILTQQNAKLVLFGGRYVDHSYIHYIEEYIKVSYRFYKNFSGEIIDEEGSKTHKSIMYYCRHLDVNSEISINSVLKMLIQNNNIRSENFANAEISIINIKKFFESGIKLLTKNEKALLKQEN
ncbi:aminoglycoside N3'-acetyltransferase [Campylobacter lari subsp. concheus]|uniref:AAC(3) family N-acetyltransferase n=1 Tax=Campylobacter lari TaxID=201 RepID=UPI00182D19DE|nr:AAC(3) family N-acetyltransferase [Campylobacter lari]EAJ5701915.1 aminoglycoside N(3)-acetyltransferase [Campylobacter lari]MCR2077962.1 AAC(3) family N-acetyltransferase [Campylobacter lari subsp. concheus]MCR2087253.1 AAC(3) family N-acetyltransferase [Campylobacter lari subsp. concheus]